MDWYSHPKAKVRAADWGKQDVAELKRKLITANHILHNQDVVDAYGHISVRHPQNRDVYIMSGYMAPALVKSSDDLIEYYVNDSSTVDPNAKKGYAERFIHGEMFRVYPEVNCVVHSHAEAVLPYVAADVRMMAVFHMAGFLGSEVPVFDVGQIYQPGDQQDMLIRNTRLGTALAKYFSRNPHQEAPSLDHTVVLMKRHGYTTHGVDIETAVYRAIYTKINAGVQSNALLIGNVRNSEHPGSSPSALPKPMSQKMLEDCETMNEGTQDKPWALWVAEVENNSLYVNKG
ncbi:hypothetical protein PFICI_07034 [Pestalotiopsis fici W106-1]|uniref:Class II aldolase/adducin N-terminal domain-containing protein n=1 Tax=Pestalotiopsis fici (strain W106-1 / CGMCC3.15140) TaxID=1229662 RepID=W3X9E6_PESFW|nr:uncharacterized protein PFICI_07034 [Pestalotiopsis fici W106-1]ETS82032.1 hypothetical protein PFICI_07034 [Pestalotiopsis fici W106-1]